MHKFDGFITTKILIFFFFNKKSDSQTFPNAWSDAFSEQWCSAKIMIQDTQSLWLFGY